MAKGIISWKRQGPQGERFEIYAHHVGNQWEFYIRQRRLDQWHPLARPPLEDWLELLDGIRRRVARRLLRPQEIQRAEQLIRDRFPEAEWET